MVMRLRTVHCRIREARTTCLDKSSKKGLWLLMGKWTWMLMGIVIRAA